MVNVLGPLPKEVMSKGRLYHNYFGDHDRLRYEPHNAKLQFPLVTESILPVYAPSSIFSSDP